MVLNLFDQMAGWKVSDPFMVHIWWEPIWPCREGVGQLGPDLAM